MHRAVIKKRRNTKRILLLVLFKKYKMPRITESTAAIAAIRISVKNGRAEATSMVRARVNPARAKGRKSGLGLFIQS